MSERVGVGGVGAGMVVLGRVTGAVGGVCLAWVRGWAIGSRCSYVPSISSHSKYPRVVVPMLDALAPPLTDILKAEAGKTAVQQEQDRFAEVHR